MGQVHDEDDAISIMVMVRTGSYHTIDDRGVVAEMMGNGGKIFGEVAGGNNGGKKRRTTSYVRLASVRRKLIHVADIWRETLALLRPPPQTLAQSNSNHKPWRTTNDGSISISRV